MPESVAPLLALAVAVALALLGAALAAGVVLAWRARGPEDTLALAVIRRINLFYLRWLHGVRPGATDPLPRSGAAIVVANHRSSVDPLAVAAQTRRLIRFLMAREYYEIFGMRWFLRTLRAIPVRRDGRDLTATKDALRALASGEIVGIFPEGRIREPRSSDTVADDDWFQSVKDGAAVLALRTGAPVVVAWVDGTPQTDSVLRAFFTRSHTRVVFAEPISFAATSATGTRRQAAEVTRKIVERLDNLRMRAGEGAAAITH